MYVLPIIDSTWVTDPSVRYPEPDPTPEKKKHGSEPNFTVFPLLAHYLDKLIPCKHHKCQIFMLTTYRDRRFAQFSQIVY